MPWRRRLGTQAIAAAGARVAANDQAVVAAAERVLVASGWSGFSLGAITREAGLSNRAIRRRFADAADAAAVLWQLRFGPALVSALVGLLTSAGLLGSSAEPPRFAESLQDLADAADTWRAAAELVVVAHYTPAVRSAIEADLAGALDDWAGADAVSHDPVRATQRAYLTANVLGLLLSHHRREGHEVDMAPVAAGMLQRFEHPLPILDLPAEPASPTRDTPSFGSGDAGLEALLTAAVRLVVDHGFDGAATAAIAKEAGFTEGFLFRRYDSKQALFVDAMARLQATALRENAEIMQALHAEHGAAYAEAMAYRDALLPERQQGRVLALEYERVSARAPLLRAHAQRESALLLHHHAAAQPQVPPAQLNGAIFGALATGIGIATLPLLLPGAVRLPFSVIARDGPGGS